MCYVMRWDVYKNVDVRRCICIFSYRGRDVYRDLHIRRVGIMDGFLLFLLLLHMSS
jgi:hypothetical protein